MTQTDYLDIQVMANAMISAVRKNASPSFKEFAAATTLIFSYIDTLSGFYEGTTQEGSSDNIANRFSKFLKKYFKKLVISTSTLTKLTEDESAMFIYNVYRCGAVHEFLPKTAGITRHYPRTIALYDNGIFCFDIYALRDEFIKGVTRYVNDVTNGKTSLGITYGFRKDYLKNLISPRKHSKYLPQIINSPPLTVTSVANLSTHIS